MEVLHNAKQSSVGETVRKGSEEYCLEEIGPSPRSSNKAHTSGQDLLAFCFTRSRRRHPVQEVGLAIDTTLLLLERS